MEEQRLRIEAIAIGFERQHHGEIAATEGHHGREELAPRMPLDQSINVCGVVAVFIEPDHHAPLAQRTRHLFFQGCGNGTRLAHGACSIPGMFGKTHNFQ